MREKGRRQQRRAPALSTKWEDGDSDGIAVVASERDGDGTASTSDEWENGDGDDGTGTAPPVQVRKVLATVHCGHYFYFFAIEKINIIRYDA